MRHIYKDIISNNLAGSINEAVQNGWEYVNAFAHHNSRHGYIILVRKLEAPAVSKPADLLSVGGNYGEAPMSSSCGRSYVRDERA